MPLPKSNTYTIDDIYALPEGQRAELIDGQIYDMAPPSPMHQELVMELSATLRDYIKKNGGPGKVCPAPFAVFLNEDDRNYVEPDISVICDSSKVITEDTRELRTSSLKLFLRAVSAWII